MKKIYIAAASLLFSTFAFAQEMNTAYFLDNYVFSHQINPASQPGKGTKGHFGFLIDNVTVASNTNVGLDNILFPVGDELVIGLNQKVSPEMFLGSLPNVVNARMALSENLLSIGARSKNNMYTNFEINLKGLVSAGMPKSFAEFAKVGYENDYYDFSGINAYANSYLEMALNFSFPLTENFYMGLGVKGLVGLAAFQANLTKAGYDLSPAEGNTSLESQGEGYFSLPGEEVRLILSPKGVLYPDLKDHFNNGIKSFVPSGFGAAIDLGFHWNTPLDGLEADLAVINIGAIRWKNQVCASFNNNKVNDIDDNEPALGELLDNLLLNCDFYKSSKFRALPMTANAGLKYHMPFYKRFSAGLFGSYQFGPVKYYEGRIGLNVTPVDQIGIAASAGYSMNGPVFGAVINFRLPVLNLYAGVDGIPTVYTPQFVPVSKINTVVKAGLLFTFGNSKM